MILLGVKDEVLASKKATFGDAGPQRLGNARENASSLTRKDLLAVEVAAIGQRRDLLAARRFLRLERHWRELGSVVTHVGHFVRHDQMVFSVNSGLHIVANDASAATARRH